MKGRRQMKRVQLTEMDLIILKGCCRSTTQKDRSMDEVVALCEAVKKCGLPDVDDERALDDVSTDTIVVDVNMENSEHTAIKRLFKEGRGNLRNEFKLLLATPGCDERLNKAKDVEDEKPTPKVVTKEA